MKWFLSLLALVMLVGAVSYSQVQTVGGITFNRATEFYKEASFTASTANDTTSYLKFAPATEIGIIGRADDSVDVNIYYQLRNSTTGAAGSWTLVDSTILTSATDNAAVETGIGVATLRGYDQVRFYFDFQTNSTDGGDGTAATYRCYYMLYKP